MLARGWIPYTQEESEKSVPCIHLQHTSALNFLQDSIRNEAVLSTHSPPFQESMDLFDNSFKLTDATMMNLPIVFYSLGVLSLLRRIA